MATKRRSRLRPITEATIERTIRYVEYRETRARDEDRYAPALGYLPAEEDDQEVALEELRVMGVRVE